MIVVKILGLIGLFHVLLWLYDYVRHLFFLKKKDLKAIYGQNSWVLVTGATDGIGFNYCTRFVKEGFNLVMISRDPVKLEKRKEELKKISPLVDIVTLAKDFTEADKAEFFKDIGEKLKGLDISIVVNNVGLSIETPFYKLTPKEIKSMFTVNVQGQIGLVKLLVPQLQKRSQKSLVVQVTSTGSMLPLSKYQVYVATKAMMHKIAEDQGLYFPEKNVEVLHCQPGLVATNMSKRKPGENIAIDFAQTTEAHGDGFMQALGNTDHTFGAFYHRIIWPLLRAVNRLLPKDIGCHLGKAAGQ